MIHCALVEAGILPCDMDVYSTHLQLKPLSCANVIVFIVDANLHNLSLEETMKANFPKLSKVFLEPLRCWTRMTHRAQCHMTGSSHYRQVNHDAADQEKIIGANISGETQQAGKKSHILAKVKTVRLHSIST